MEEKEKEIFADLHIHSKYSRATSKNLDIPNLVKYARIKGVNLLGTGDFQHPKWFEELSQLEERDGLIYHDGFPFLWQSEIALIHTQGGKGRRVHYVLLAPNREVVKQITAFLLSKGRVDYDGRPIFGFSGIELVDEMGRISPEIEIICAHAWTPWFGIFGSMSGFDSLKEAFEEKANKIHAIETGMSSDPEMNWRIKELNNKTIMSSSDSHAFWPWRMGREATIFSGELSYKNILKQIRENSFVGTVEVDPAYGKYHWDGHRLCNFSCSPQETKKINGICPKCGNKLVIGVENRIEELAEHPVDFKPSNAKPFYRILPLHEMIALAKNTSVSSKGVAKIYEPLLAAMGNEFEILLKKSREEILRVLPKEEKLADLILRNRVGKIKVKPGYDGEYGVALLEEKTEEQKTLF